MTYRTLNEVTQFIEDIGEINDLPSLKRRLQTAIEVFGFTSFSVAGYLRRTTPFEYHVLMANMPSGFVAAYNEKYTEGDPSIPDVISGNKCILWSETAASEEAVSSGYRNFLKFVRTYGMDDGLTIPIHRPGTYCGVVVLGGERPDISQESIILSQLLAIYGHDRALDIFMQDREVDTPREKPITLTPRERECIRWVSEGKSDWEISEIVGISQSTVHFHVENAKKKLNVRTRVQVVVQAMSQGQIMQ